MNETSDQACELVAQGRRQAVWSAVGVMSLALALAMVVTTRAGASLGPSKDVPARAASHLSAGDGEASGGTVWLCRPGLADNPCTANLDKTVVEASGATSAVDTSPAASSRFDCFYVYPTVSGELATNADLRVQKAETDVAEAQASRFSRVCRVFAPMYRQVTLVGLASYPSLDVPAGYGKIAYASLLSGFEDYLAKYNDGHPIIFIGHSQGAAILIKLLASRVDNDASLRSRLVLAMILGGDVEVRTGALTGGSFSHIPACSRAKEVGCVIAYSSFPGEPPATALFGRPGQGVALQSGQRGTRGLQVLCVNPAAIGGGTAGLDPFFPSEGAAPTPWVEFPGLYSARCETSGGAAWLQVRKITGPSDKRPVVTEADGPDWGYHTEDVNLALGNLVADVSSAEATWTAAHRLG
jgi:hypothetical protein